MASEENEQLEKRTALVPACKWKPEAALRPAALCPAALRPAALRPAPCSPAPGEFPSEEGAQREGTRSKSRLDPKAQASGKLAVYSSQKLGQISSLLLASYATESNT